MALRYDIGELRPPRRLPDGRLVADAIITRTGVFEYRLPDGSVRREYRPPSEVFKADSMASFTLAPVTDDHPPELIDSTNATRYTRGSTGESVRRAGDNLVIPVAVFDAELIRKMENGKRDVSCGYEVDLDESPGMTPGGERYDAVQRNIRGNHVAIVSVGRAGTARVRMDAGYQTVAGAASHNKEGAARPGRVAPPVTPCYKGQTMSAKDSHKDLDTAQLLERLDAAEKRAEDLQQRLDAAERRAAEAEGRLESTTERLTTAEAKLDAAEDPEIFRDQIRALEIKLVESEQARQDALDPERMREAVRERVGMEAAAREVLGDKEAVKFDGMSDRDLMTRVVEKLHGVSIDAEKSIEFVRGRFDAAVEGYRSSGAALERVRRSVTIRKADAARKDAEESPRQKMIKRNLNAWKGGANKETA